MATDKLFYGGAAQMPGQGVIQKRFAQDQLYFGSRMSIEVAWALPAIYVENGGGGTANRPSVLGPWVISLSLWVAAPKEGQLGGIATQTSQDYAEHPLK